MSTAVSVQKLRERFPEPVAFMITRGESDYCVGGTLIMWLIGVRSLIHVPEKFRFPEKEELSFHLIIANTSLTKGESLRRAHHIITADGRGDQERAWSLLDRALRTKGSSFKDYEGR